MNKKNLKVQSKTNWDPVNKLKNKDINYSDIPELDDTFFKKAKIEMPHTKDSVTLRIDHDVLEWFKQHENKYQSRINAILRAYYKAHHKGC
ncbi:MAG: BrnA antitoxin family protein [Pseudomonadota bacterium]